MRQEKTGKIVGHQAFFFFQCMNCLYIGFFHSCFICLGIVWGSFADGNLDFGLSCQVANHYPHDYPPYCDLKLNSGSLCPQSLPLEGLIQQGHFVPCHYFFAVLCIWGDKCWVWTTMDYSEDGMEYDDHPYAWQPKNHALVDIARKKCRWSSSQWGLRMSSLLNSEGPKQELWFDIGKRFWFHIPGVARWWLNVKSLQVLWWPTIWMISACEAPCVFIFQCRSWVAPLRFKEAFDSAKQENAKAMPQPCATTWEIRRALLSGHWARRISRTERGRSQANSLTGQGVNLKQKEQILGNQRNRQLHYHVDQGGGGPKFTDAIDPISAPKRWSIIQMVIL